MTRSPRTNGEPTQSAPFLYCNECGMQKVAEMMPPLRPRDGFAARGSRSLRESCLFSPPVKLMRRRISWFDFAPEAASLGDCAIVSRSWLILWGEIRWAFSTAVGRICSQSDAGRDRDVYNRRVKAWMERFLSIGEQEAEETRRAQRLLRRTSVPL